MISGSLCLPLADGTFPFHPFRNDQTCLWVLLLLSRLQTRPDASSLPNSAHTHTHTLSAAGSSHRYLGPILWSSSLTDTIKFDSMQFL